MSESGSTARGWTRFRDKTPPRGHRAGTSLAARPLHFLVRRGDGDLPSLAKWTGDLDGLYVSFEPFSAGVRGYRGTYHDLAEMGSENWQWLELPEGT